MWSGMSFVLRYLCHVGCIIVEFGAGSVGSFLCSVVAYWRRVDLSVFNAV